MGVTPEWTPRATPQVNHVKNSIYIVTMHGCTPLAVANIPNHYKNILLPYAVKYAYMTRELEFIDIDGTASTWYKDLCGKLPKFIRYMHLFGKAGILKDCPENSPKSCKCGVTCMFVGYVPTSSGNFAVLVNPTNCFQHYKLRDVIFLKRQYFTRDPNISHNGCVLIIKGLDPLLLEQGSEIRNDADQTETQQHHFGILDANSEDKENVPAPWQPPHHQQQPYTTCSGRQVATTTNLTYGDTGE